MLMALANQKLINAKDAKKQSSYQCPICQEPVILKKGAKLVAHFAHYSTSTCVGSAGETQLHLQGKQLLWQDLVQYYPKIKLEVYLADLKQRPDLLSGRLAFEYQCSPITNHRLKARVQGYQTQQINSVWILGMNYFKRRLQADSVLRFLRYKPQLGFYLLFFDPIYHHYHVKYHIVQFENRLVCQLKTFNNYQSFVNFFQHSHQISYPKPNLIKLAKTIESQVRLGSTTMLHLQQLCYQKRHLITGCPIILHYPTLMPPFLNQNWLTWKVKIVLYLETQQVCQLSELEKLVEYNEFLFIKTFNPALLFLQVLRKAGYVKIEREKVTLCKDFVWYRDTYAKITAIQQKMRMYDDN